MKDKLRLKSLTEYFAVLMIIISSGSVFFVIKNCEATLFTLLASAILVAICGKISVKTLKKNFAIFVIILAAVFFNLAVNWQYSVYDKDLIILLIRMTSLLIIQSTIEQDKFIKKYVEILVVLAALSLLLFSYTMLINQELPGIIHDGYDFTFYHTTGHGYFYTRNSGIFWEAPAHSVFLNIALCMLSCRKELFSDEYFKYAIILAVTIISTLSVFAFVCLAINILIMWKTSKKHIKQNKLVSKNSSRLRFWIIILCVVLFMALVVVELKYQIISHKLINKKGSYNTRFNDTLFTIQLALKRPLTGFGIFNNYTTEVLKSMNVVNNSNGLAVFIMDMGIIRSVLGIGWIVWQQRKLYKVKWDVYILVLALLFLYHFSEHLWLFTLFISMLFSWKKEKYKS